MKFLDCGVRQRMAVVGGLLVVLYGAPAGAQENLYGNKTPAQIFATDCAICHKSPQGLSKAGGAFGLGLESFLRSHYTASRESASAIAKYIQAMDSGPVAPDRGPKRAAKPTAKKSDAKPAEAKAGEGTASESKPVEVKTEAKPEPKAEAKPAEKSPEAKPTEAAKP